MGIIRMSMLTSNNKSLVYIGLPMKALTKVIVFWFLNRFEEV